MNDEGLRLGPLRQMAPRADDLDAPVAFYNDVLGLELIARLDPPGLSFVRLGDTRIPLERGARRATLHLRVGDIQAAYATLQGRAWCSRTSRN